MRHTVAMVALATGITVAPLVAQQHQHRQTGQDSTQQVMSMCHDMNMMGGMMMGMTMDTAMMGEMRGDRMQRMQGEMRASGRWMMDAMRFVPKNILAHQGELDLDGNQVARIQALTERQAEPANRMAEMQRVHERVREAFNATPPDTAGIRSAFEHMAEVGARMHIERFTAAAVARAVLTPAQRVALEELPHPCGMNRPQDQPSGAAHDQHHANR